MQMKKTRLGGDWNMIFIHRLGIVIPTDELICFRGVFQPPISTLMGWAFKRHPERMRMISLMGSSGGRENGVARDPDHDDYHSYTYPEDPCWHIDQK